MSPGANERPTQERRVLEALLEAEGGWVNGRHFLQTMMLSQYHRAIHVLERRDGVKIEHSDFADEYGFKSYRIPADAGADNRKEI